jgi:hypothetical protein
MPCKLPSHLIRPPDRLLRDVAIGETVYVVYSTMQPDMEGFCHLDAESTVYARPNNIRMRVTRAADGFHVGISRSDVNWELRRLLGHGWYPVESIAEDPPLDLE